jgi:hypothetical protein
VVTLPRETKSRHAVKYDGSLLRLVDRFSDYSGRFAVQVCSVQVVRSFSEFARSSQQGQQVPNAGL